MKLLVILLTFVSLALCAAGAAAAAAAKLKTMHFYMHDIVGTKNATTVMVATPNANRTFAALGSVIVIDDRLTEGASVNSRQVGRARGAYMSDSLPPAPSGIFMAFSCVFANGTLSLQGQDDFMLPVRELAVAGGTGAFRFARGYAEIRTQAFNPPDPSAILDVRVFYIN